MTESSNQDWAQIAEEAGIDGSIQPAKAEKPSDTRSLESELVALRYSDHQLDYKLKKFLGPAVTALVVSQVVLMNLCFILYVVISFAFQTAPNPTVVVTYLGTSTAEVIGLAIVVTRYLFPERGADWTKDQ